MNGNVLNGNVCSVTPINVSVPPIGGQILPELSLPTFSSRDQNAVHFLRDRDKYLKLKSVDELLKLTLVSASLLKRNFPKTGLWQPKNILTVMRSLKYNFWINLGVSNQSHTQRHRFTDVGMISLQTAVWLHIF